MGHYAEVRSGVVQRVIVADQALIDSGHLGDPTQWVACSYNANIHGCFPGIGFTFDGLVFKPPQPDPTWIFDTDRCAWEPPGRPTTTALWVTALGQWMEPM